MNPYQDLNIYTGLLIDEYYGTELFELPPHLYAVANAAYYAMKEENSDQVREAYFMREARSLDAIEVTCSSVWVRYVSDPSAWRMVVPWGGDVWVCC